MRNLINFLLKNSSWFVFILLELVCLYFIFTSNSYQKSIYLNSSNEIVGRAYSISGSVISYFGLKQENVDLLEKNAELQSHITGLKDYIYKLEGDSIKTKAFLDSLSNKVTNDRFIVAHVVNNSISRTNNFITINKGAKDGVKEDLGVISQQGIVGVVRGVSENFAIVQPLLNPNSRFSCKVLNSNAAGTLIWDGGDPRYANLTEYPKYEHVAKGDTIVTSGFSDIFPEGIFVGTIESYESQTNDNFYSLRVRLSTDFGSLKNILILRNTNKEKMELESRIENAKK